MSSEKLYPTSKNIAEHALLNKEKYEQMYAQSINDKDAFWAEQATQFLNWSSPWEEVCSHDSKHKITQWFAGGTLNACYNCLDRHLPQQGHKKAIIWECDDPGPTKKLSYNELFELVCRFANVLKSRGVKKGNRVCIYMPMIPEITVAMLACSRIGAVHSVVFAGFSSDMLAQRILDSDCRVVVTADEGIRGGKHIALKENVEKALEQCSKVHTTVIVQRTGSSVPINHTRDIWYHDVMRYASSECPCEVMQATDPLFIIYTSGSTGKPKGIVHSTAGYLLYAAITFKYVFDYHDNEIFWSSADMGWITGHSYALYGPFLNAATTVMFEGVPGYPNYSRYWQIIDKHQVNIFYTSPTVIRGLMAQDIRFVRSASLKSLRLLGTVGEPINTETWKWFHQQIGKGRCPIVNTWWQTETGGVCITPLASVYDTKASSAGHPFFGILPIIVDDEGQEVSGAKHGNLALKGSWPGQMQTIYGNHKRFTDNYYSMSDLFYLTGDGAYRDEDGYFWLSGRVDDFINVSGHRLGTAEIENAITTHENVAEAAVVGFSHKIKGQGLYAFVTLKSEIEPSNILRNELMALVIQQIGAIARPDIIQWSDSLPKTRSGKIVRRILRQIAENKIDDIGDTSVLINVDCIDKLIKGAAMHQSEMQLVKPE